MRCLTPSGRALHGSLLLLALLASIVGSAQDDDAAATPEKSVDRYHILWERNIFNPDRVKQRPTDAPTEEEAPVTAPEVQVRVVLTGVLLVGNARTAFFEGTGGDFNAHGVEGEKIGEFTLENVRIDGVVLALESERYELPLGGAMTSSESAGWTVEQISGGALSTAGSAGADATESGDGLSVLEKLKARRQQELEK